MDRYEALGIKKPHPDEICMGKCEGVGILPVPKDQLLLPENKRFIPLWKAAHKSCRGKYCDGWHFVRCPDCGGSGVASVRIEYGEEGKRKKSKGIGST